MNDEQCGDCNDFMPNWTSITKHRSNVSCHYAHDPSNHNDAQDTCGHTQTTQVIMAFLGASHGGDIVERECDTRNSVNE